MARGFCLVVAAVLLGGFPGPARGQSRVDPATRAKADYERGVMAYDLGDYDRAILAFTRAHKIDPAPVLLYNIAQAYRKKGDHRQATAFYRRYLEAAPGAEDRKSVEARIRELQAKASVPTPAAPPAAVPPASGFWEPGSGSPAREVKPAVFAAPGPIPPRGAEEATESPPAYRRPWFWGTVGVAALGTIAAFFLLQRHDLWNCQPAECFTTRTVQ